MAITLYLYSLSKRENSTKLPTGTGISVSVTLLDDTSLMNPTFKLSLASNPIGYNYAYVPDFSRYYFIQDISSRQNFWYISCSCDVLASFKTAIGTGNHYVLRSASSYDGTISDSVYPATTDASMVISAPASPYDQPFKWSNGVSYVLGIVGPGDNSTQQTGSLIYYHMDSGALFDFAKWLMDNVDDWSNLAAEYSPGVQQALINPMQYIKSCMLIPVSPPSTMTASRIRFGYYEYVTGAVGHVAIIHNNNPIYQEVTKISVPSHPQAATRGTYLNCQPYSEHILHVGPFGDIPLDPMLVQENSSIALTFKFDMFSGMCQLRVYGDTVGQDVFFTGTTQIGVNINLSQVYIDGLAVTQAETRSIFGMLGSALNADVGGLFNAATTGLQDTTRLSYPTVTGLPDGGSYIPFFDPVSCYIKSKFLPIVDEDLAEIGRPLCQLKTISTLSGYILCQNADCQITGTQEEAQKINQYMNTGFFYE